MFAYWWAAVAAVLAIALVALILWPRLRARRAEARLAYARQRFHQRREWLEAKFMTLASESGKPRGLAWIGCDFDNSVEFARDRETGQLRAFTAVTIRFEAVEGGGMEHVEAVGNLRAATAVFHWEDEQWKTDGRAIFNLNPMQAIAHFHHHPVSGGGMVE